MLFQSYQVRLRPGGRITIPPELARWFWGRKLDRHSYLAPAGESLLLFDRPFFERIAKALLDKGVLDHSDLRRKFFGSTYEKALDETRELVLPGPLEQFLHPTDSLYLLSIGRRARVLTRERWELLWHETSSEQAREFLRQTVGASRLTSSESADEDAGLRFDTAVRELESLSDSDPRRLELAVAEVFASFPRTLVEVTQPSKDGGVDVIVRAPRGNGWSVLFVECKSGQRKASVHEIRELLGVVSRDRANAGLLVSRSGFTKDAIREAEGHRIRVQLTTAGRLAAWIEQSCYGASANSGSG